MNLSADKPPNIHGYIDYYIDHTHFPLLPIKPDKAPYTRNGVYGATRDRMQLQMWANQYPDIGLAIPTGPISGLVVVDIDVGYDSCGEDSLKELYPDIQLFDHDKYLWATTPSGGWHWYFLWDNDYPVTSKIRAVQLVDIKGQGGYVGVEPTEIVYSSGHRDRYQFHDITKPPAPMPDWLKNLITRARNADQDDPSNKDIDFKGCIDGFTQGSRENSMFKLAWAMRLNGIHYEVARSWIELTADNCKPPFSKREAVSKLNRAYSYKLNTNEE